jgi:UDP-3-O-[3-hydroxymyristoyl] N-acetylglucosamine deacetylase/3-hydroxyacyl-[acyl-carrier-protein] dehydratase
MSKMPTAVAHQHTIAQPVRLDGQGLFSGQPVEVAFTPAPPHHGIVFVRRDLNHAPIPALVHYVVKRPRRTALKNGEAEVHTVEHVLSALAGLGIDNLTIELTAGELPNLDGSALPYIDALQSAGLRAQEDAPRRVLKVKEPIVVKVEDAVIAALPCDEPAMQVFYELDYGNGGPLGRQVRHFDMAGDDYVRDIAPARTFALEAEARELRARGVGSHLTEKDVLILGDQGPIGNELRFDDEPVRHKVLDLIGDLYLVGAPIQGRIVAYKSGHPLNHLLARKLLRQLGGQIRRDSTLHKTVLDIRKLTRILPHRYPMLLVDRVIEIDGERRAVGVKNVSINEPFFTGHYPGTPIMPGVLIVEAMAQLSGVLIAQGLEHTGKLAVLLSLDRVKLRRPVIPGDQLVLEAEAVKIRSRIAHMRCRAYVADDLAAEAEVKFMLVDDEQE